MDWMENKKNGKSIEVFCEKMKIEVITMILVSSCLAGLEVRYNGTYCLNEKIQQLVEENQVIAVCPP